MMIYVLVMSGMTEYFIIVCFSVNVNAIKFLFDDLFWALAKIFTTELLQQLQQAIFFYWRSNDAISIVSLARYWIVCAFKHEKTTHVQGQTHVHCHRKQTKRIIKAQLSLTADKREEPY